MPVFKVTVKSNNYDKISFYAKDLSDVYEIMKTVFRYGVNIAEIITEKGEEIKESEGEDK